MDEPQQTKAPNYHCKYGRPEDGNLSEEGEPGDDHDARGDPSKLASRKVGRRGWQRSGCAAYRPRPSLVASAASFLKMPLVKEIVIEMALEQSVVMSHLTFFFLVAALVRFSPSHTMGRRLHDDDRRSGLLHGLPWQRVHNWACKNHLWPIRFL